MRGAGNDLDTAGGFHACQVASCIRGHLESVHDKPIQTVASVEKAAVAGPAGMKKAAPLLVSVHLPKTGGVSFFSVLKAHFQGGLLRDYDDVPINTPLKERISSAFQAGVSNLERDFSGVLCVHGHFLPVKYLPLSSLRADVRFITWMRHPVERMVSHYGYWKRNFDPSRSQALHRKVVEEDWSLETFCLAPEFRNFYGQFLYAFPLENFSFVGITEHYEEDLAFFARNYLESHAMLQRLNAAPERASSGMDAGLRREIEHFHSDDMKLYDRALQARLERLASSGSRPQAVSADG